MWTNAGVTRHETPRLVVIAVAVEARNAPVSATVAKVRSEIVAWENVAVCTKPSFCVVETFVAGARQTNIYNNDNNNNNNRGEKPSASNAIGFRARRDLKQKRK